MQIVETAMRPARLAFAFSPDASSRVLRRAFRLAGGRWGGRSDLMLCVDPATPFSEFNRIALRAADPDYLLILDPHLDGYGFEELCDELQVQPFEIVRFRERMEDSEGWAWLFRETPTIPTGEEVRRGVLDIDRSGVRWGRAAFVGLPLRTTVFDRIPASRAPESPWVRTPVQRGQMHLSEPIEDRVWLYYGPRSDIELASEYWTVRALGMRVSWRSALELRRPSLPRHLVRSRSTRVYLRASPLRAAEAQAAAVRWRTADLPVEAWPFSLGATIPAVAPAPVFSQQILPVFPHAERLRFSTPPPPVIPRLPRRVEGVALHRVLSPDVADPDGLILARDRESRALVQPGAHLGRRVTQTGFAERVNLAQPDLIDLPLIQYEEALSAPLRAAGYVAAHSDKGRYHQRTLHLSRGLLFLCWVLRQPESAHLLDLFFVRPQGAPVTYRRAVRFAEMRECVYEDARGDRLRLRAGRRATADDWLEEWTSALLSRELVLAGHLLDCPECSARLWYRARATDQRFTCERCDATSVVPADTLRTFRLNEAFFSFRHQGGHAVTFSLARLRRAARESFLYYPETLVRRGNSEREIDALALVDGRLVVVEAKTNNTILRNEVSFYRGLARRARAERLVFATTSRRRRECGTAACPCLGQPTRDHAWDDGSRARIAEVREQLDQDGVAVETWCHRDLVMEPALPPLGPFTRMS